MPTPTRLTEEIECKAADEWLARLSATDALWTSTGGIWDQNDGERNWVFRGQSNAEWGLVPAAFRPRAFHRRGIGSKYSVNPANVEELLELEEEAVNLYVRAAIRAGLPLPEDSQWFRNGDLIEAAFGKLLRHELGQGINFPFVLQRSLYALAQHHGVPTRLLDWTESPLVAAYFAVREAAKEMSELNSRVRISPSLSKQAERLRRQAETNRVRAEGKCVAVWALRQLAVGETSHAQVRIGLEPTIEWVEAPYAGNPNLKAQRGLFSLIRHHRSAIQQKLPLATIDSVVERFESHPDTHGVTSPWLRKLTLPWSQAPRALRLLDGFNVNAAFLFPGYDGVLTALNERAYWAP